MIKKCKMQNAKCKMRKSKAGAGENPRAMASGVLRGG